MHRGALLPAAAVAALGSLAAAGTASADTFGCRASVVRVTSGLPAIEPLVAANCGGDGAGASGLDLPAQSPATVHADGAYAATATGADGVRTSEAALSNVVATLGQPGQAPGLTVKAQALFARVQYRCTGGVATQVARTSRVTGLQVNDNPDPFAALTPDDGKGGVFQVTNQISGSPLGQALRITANADDPGSGARRALRIELLAPSAGAAPTVTVDLAEAGVTAVCDPPAAGDTASGGGSAAGSGSNQTTSTTVVQRQPAQPGSGSSSALVGASGSGKVVINGRNGGCGRVRMWFTKVKDHGTLKGAPRSATSRFGDRAVLRGVLRSCAGKPIVGARLDVVHEFAGRRLVKTGLKSRAGGRLTLILPMNVSSRALTIAYRGDLARGKITSRQRLRLTVRDRRGRVVRVPPRASLR